MMSIFNDYFSSVFPAIAKEDHITTNDSDNNGEIDSAPLTNSEHTLPNFDITTEDVLKAISGWKVNKTLGFDNTYPKILKETKSEIVDALTALFNFSLPSRL